MNAATTPQPIALDIADAARSIGFTVPTLRRIIKRGEIPAAIIGRRYRIRPEAIQNYLKAEEERRLRPHLVRVR